MITSGCCPLTALAQIWSTFLRRVCSKLITPQNCPAVATRLDEVAHGGDTINVAVPLQMVLSLEGVVTRKAAVA